MLFLYPVVIHCHPLSAVVPLRYPSLTVTCHCYLLLPVVTRYYPLSPVTTPLGELTHSYAYYSILYFMNYMYLKFQPSILISKII